MQVRLRATEGEFDAGCLVATCRSIAAARWPGLPGALGSIRVKVPASGGRAREESRPDDARVVHVALATTHGLDAVPSQPWKYATGLSGRSGNTARFEARAACRRSAGGRALVPGCLP